MHCPPALQRPQQLGKLLSSCRLSISFSASCRRTASSMGRPQAVGCQEEPDARQLLSVAPMMDWTDVHYRQLARYISKHTWLYTEMVVDNTLIHQTNRDRWLWFPPEQHPIVCQLGGSSPSGLASAARIVADYGYDEINLNCGCPSDRVAGAGCFGAALMKQPELVAACCAAMQDAVSIPVTVKCRLGVDDMESYELLCHFVRTVSSQSRVRHFVLHARKCLLQGLSPAENRTIPPLRWGWVYALARDFPDLQFSLNGGVELGSTAQTAIERAPSGGGRIHGVMIGRGAYNMPWTSLSSADSHIFGWPAESPPTRRQVLAQYAQYADKAVGQFGTKPDGTPAPGVRVVLKPLLALFHGEKGCKLWKRALDAGMKTPASASQLIKQASLAIPDKVLDAPPALPPSAVFDIGDLPEPVSLSPSQSIATHEHQIRDIENDALREGHRELVLAA